MYLPVSLNLAFSKRQDNNSKLLETAADLMIACVRGLRDTHNSSLNEYRDIFITSEEK